MSEANILEKALLCLPRDPATGLYHCLIACPVTGFLREVCAIELRDGGKITFPRSFSDSSSDQFKEALPQLGTSSC